MTGFFERLNALAIQNPQQAAMAEEGLRTSYGELADAIRGMDPWLRERGLAPGATVGLQDANSVAMAVTLLGCAAAGMRILLLDSSLKPAEAHEHLKRAGAAALLASGCPLPPGADIPALAAPSLDTLRTLAAALPREVLAAAGSAANNGAFLLLSSGTTGLPKIVVRTAAQAEAAVSIFAAGLPLHAGDRVLGVLPLCHSFGLLYMLLTTLNAGASLHFQSFSPRATARAVAADGITVMPATPFMFRLLAQTEFSAPPDFSAVRMAISAGSALPRSVARQFRTAFGVDIIQSYGSTESGPIAFGTMGDETAEPGRVGRPYPGVLIGFSGQGAPAAADVAGQPVTAESPAAAEGYLNNPEATAAVFERRTVRTGDLGRLAADGSLIILGRERPMLNVAGKKVAPAEVEACLRLHPRVHDVLVTGEATEDGAQKIVAMIVPSGAVTAMELREHVTQRLAHYKAPREIRFLENLSSGPMGKVALGRHA